MRPVKNADLEQCRATLQICKAGVARMRKIWFSRHGESEYNMFAKIGGDSNISPQGQVYAKLLPDLLVDRVPLVSSITMFGSKSVTPTGRTQARHSLRLCGAIGMPSMFNC